MQSFQSYAGRVTKPLIASAMVMAGASLPQISWANGCQQSNSSSYPCVASDSGKGIARTTFSMPGINTANAISPGQGPSSGQPAAFAGLRTNQVTLGDETGAAAAGGGNRWNAWMSLGQNNVNNGFQPAQVGGHVDLTLVGIDYTYASNVVAGVAATWDRTRVGGQGLNGGTINGSGYNIAPYVSVPLGRNWLLDGTIGFGRNDISIVDNNPNPAPTASGSTKSDRMFTSVAVSYAQTMGKVMWSGKLAWVTNEDKIAAFTMSPAATGGPVAGSTIRVSQLRLGGQAAFNAGMLMPYVGLTYVRDLQSPDATPLRGQTPANDKDGWVVALGLNIYSKGALSGGVMLSSETGRQQIKNDLFMANIAVRF